MSQNKYKIWSNEHTAWWAPNRHGYTQDRRRAGIYDEDEAFKIVEQANEFQIWSDDQGPVIPNETLIPLTKEDL